MTTNIISEVFSCTESNSTVREFFKEWCSGEEDYNDFLRGVFCSGDDPLEDQADTHTSFRFIEYLKNFHINPKHFQERVIFEIDCMTYDIILALWDIPGCPKISNLEIKGNSLLLSVLPSDGNDLIEKIKAFRNKINESITA